MLRELRTSETTVFECLSFWLLFHQNKFLLTSNNPHSPQEKSLLNQLRTPLFSQTVIRSWPWITPVLNRFQEWQHGRLTPVNPGLWVVTSDPCCVPTFEHPWDFLIKLFLWISCWVPLEAGKYRGKYLGSGVRSGLESWSLTPDPETFLNHPANDRLATFAHSFWNTEFSLHYILFHIILKNIPFVSATPRAEKYILEYEVFLWIYP